MVYDAPLGLDEAPRRPRLLPGRRSTPLVAPVTAEPKLRKLLRNMAYVGVLARLLGIELAEVERAIGKQFGEKAKARELNVAAARAGFEHAATLEKRDPLRVRAAWTRPRARSSSTATRRPRSARSSRGVTVVAWYPITPSSSLVETLSATCGAHRIGPGRQGDLRGRPGGGRARAIGMVDRRRLGGRARDDRDLAAPGISLMSEFAGLAYYAEIPGGDLRRPARRPVHGPARPARRRATCSRPRSSRTATRSTCVLLPGSVEECFTMAVEAFDLAERLQTPVFVMSDLDLGMNIWMSRAVRLPAQPDRPRQGALDGGPRPARRRSGRYEDVDGDGIG